MRVRVGVGAAMVIACVGLSACAGGGGDSGSSGDSSETEATSSSSTSSSPAAEVPGERVSRSVASFVLPDGVEFTEKVVRDEPNIEYHQWTATYPGTDEPSCRIGLEIESEVGDQALVGLLMEAKQMRSEGLESAEMDPNAPEGLQGSVLHYVGTGEKSDGTPVDFDNIARTFQTPGNTLIALVVNSNADGPPECDAEAIAATLQWSGEERPVGGAAS